MGKILSLLGSVIAAICVATVIAAVVLVVFYAQSWKIDHQRLMQALAILQGKSPESLVPPSPPKKKESDADQPTFEQFLTADNLKARDLEQRELTVRANLRQFQQELDKIAEEKKRVQSVRDELQAKLDDLAASTTSAGMDNVLETLQSLKPKQAKELLAQRLEKGDIDTVVKILSAMTNNKRAKIIAEFKTATELEQIGEVLNRIRQGQPAEDLLDATGKKLQPPKGPGA